MLNVIRKRPKNPAIATAQNTQVSSSSILDADNCGFSLLEHTLSL